jgi:hypothetical protein
MIILVREGQLIASAPISVIEAGKVISFALYIFPVWAGIEVMPVK